MAPRPRFKRFKSFKNMVLSGLAAVGLSGALAADASAQAGAGLVPDKLFLQAGAGEEAQMIVGGAIWSWELQRDFASGRLTGYWEASFGRWHGEDGQGTNSSAWVTQLGITPVLRWSPRAWGEAWFVEGGVGANLLLPVYRSRDKQFSTAFNFGDHLGIGRSFGADRRHEIALRYQHFSNGGIKKPNPGEDFLQLRYTWRY